MTVRKAERLLNLIAFLLETDRLITPQQIQDTVPGYADQSWEAFKRMFERDKEALREVGIPLEVAPMAGLGEPEEGYRIPKDRYYLPELDLAAEELASLWLAAGLVRLQDPTAARTALLKLAGELPPEVERARLSWLSADLGLAVPGLPRAFEAVAERRTITFDYRGRSGVQTRTLDPYGLVHRKGTWYLVGHDHDRGENRSFRLDRVSGDIQFRGKGGPGADFVAPEGFRPQEALEVPPFVGRDVGRDVGREEGLQAVDALVRFDASTAWWIERTHPWLRLDWEGDGTASAQVPVSDNAGFISWLLSLGEGVELLEPAALRGEVLARLEEICD
ncbi:MAG: transcriptional regulator protein-like protein [Actinobacteria bacterium]|nr:transcriptional regulator protein-like protein [Actinomycetota bacterium]MEA2534253.1 proteasome accessory factor [Actinomycetota bacterium]MEA2565283.1 proteasome accessory factor [Actinomycetota bacterium]MEA2591493.1 proteasome accessory factor [Actinomycetota bacterium]